VRLDPVLNARSQRTALMMSAQGALSHSPSRNWRCYSAVGAANAGKSNLALAYPNITSAGVVNQYMKDSGSNNYGVGHRRWLLNPFATTMGSGSTRTANAVTVIGPKSMSRPNPRFVSWPSAGYFPRTLEPQGRWSLSAGNRNTDFRRATVRVSRNGKPVGVRKYRVENGYAQPTLVWQMRAGAVASGTVHVIVSGIRVAGSHRVYSRNYYVRMFAPR
ncbi:MAG: CAP domain-containing protein, partial [Marmoricola sp.]